MTNNQVNYLNIGLIFVALILAFKLPFELFLFAYAVLGPLHYLTEIAWLKKKNFFTKGKRDWLILTTICFLYFICYMLVEFSSKEWAEPYYISVLGENYKESISFLGGFSTHFIFMGFAISLAMVMLKKTLHKIIFALVAMVLAWAMSGAGFYAVVFSIFLPTLIHVSIFTGAFMLYGALKAKSTSGVITFFVFILAGLLCFYGSVDEAYVITEATFDSYWSTSFQALNFEMLDMAGKVEAPMKPDDLPVIFRSELGVMIQRFIAFSYLYHYLNWFSKTTVIKWHKVPVKWWVFVIVIWIASISLYYYNYRVGLLALLFLSMLHVFLEFPLNYQSFIGIGQELGARIFGGKKEAKA